MTHRILLADDSATIRKVVELTFSDEDFAIDSVGDGSQAFEHARAQRPDIIISDVIMPGLNGYELCQRCKTDPDLQSVPFLFLRGTFESFDEDKARSCGADGFIVKPFESQEMIAKVKDLIARSATAPAPVAAAPRPVPAGVRPVAPRPVMQQRPAAGPPPIPAMQPRPAPAPAPPAVPLAPVRPAPPVPPWPTRPAPAAPLSAPPVYQPPPSAQPPVSQTPPAPPPPRPTPPVLHQPLSQPTPPAPPVPQALGDDFGFDFGDAVDDRSGAPGQPEVGKGAAAGHETSGESDEDLWSEVSLRGNADEFLEEGGLGGADAGSGADILELSEEAALHAPDVLFEDEPVFEEVSTARRMPLAPIVEPPAVRVKSPLPEPEPLPEPAPAPVPPPVASAAPVAPVAIDQAEIERIVSARVEAAVRAILEPIVGDLARPMIESVAWEVIPELAEAMIRAEIERVRQSTRND